MKEFLNLKKQKDAGNDLLTRIEALEKNRMDFAVEKLNLNLELQNSVQRTRFPNLKIFVISKLGLQSSGKSTLLNALFACKIAVSARRCTRGLVMRFLFLDKDLSNQLGVDAFILIDTEGLCAPEKMGDPKSEKKNRILANFALQISNLTIINILGNSEEELNKILRTTIGILINLNKPLDIFIISAPNRVGYYFEDEEKSEDNKENMDEEGNEKAESQGDNQYEII
ncbi:interferon-induced very large GTPase 1-like [Gigaspora margarita]|uniref:Interferon-induced very large GTPase 1-like n=1 Tax=Gigaspora margarita TaxID=4874 RepID=A0A8H3XHZ6_GIGMA|nr:interferon-induced very large GTPase 1-like [Gigaspora margarita]